MTQQIHDAPFDDYLYDCVTINEHDLQGEFTRVPADLAYWSRRAADAERDYLMAGVAVKEAEATSQATARAMLENDPTIKRVTEAMVDAEAQRSPSLRAAHESYARAAATRKEIGGYLSAIGAKRDMLISLGAHIRQELQSDPSLRTR